MKTYRRFPRLLLLTSLSLFPLAEAQAQAEASPMEIGGSGFSPSTEARDLDLFSAPSAVLIERDCAVSGVSEFGPRRRRDGNTAEVGVRLPLTKEPQAEAQLYARYNCFDQGTRSE